VPTAILAEPPPGTPEGERCFALALGHGVVAVLIDVGVSTVGDWSVVAPVGELDLASVPRLRQEVLNLLGAGARDVVLDLGAVDFIDSVGLGGVVAVAKRVRGAGGRFRLARPDPRVWEVFSLVGLDRVFDCHGSVASAADA